MLGLFANAASEPNTQMLPACAMGLWTLSNLGLLAYNRFQAGNNKTVQPQYYKTYDTKYGGEPPFLTQLGQHIENSFETPTLFHAVCLGLVATRTVTPATVALGWAYFAARVVHTIVHVGSNNVVHRFLAFIASIAALTALWVNLTMQLALK
jgi:hypothetical protein